MNYIQTIIIGITIILLVVFLLDLTLFCIKRLVFIPKRKRRLSVFLSGIVDAYYKSDLVTGIFRVLVTATLGAALLIYLGHIVGTQI